MKPIFVISLLILMAGCSSYTSMPVEHLETPHYFKEAMNVDNAGLEPNWWLNFHNEKLNELVKQALKNNINYKITLNDIDTAKNAAKNAIFNAHFLKIQVDILEAKSRMAQLTLISEVVNVYFKISTINANIQNVTQQQHILNSLLKITNTQYDIGYIDSLAFRNEKVKQNTINENLKHLRKQQKIYLNHLADLLSQYPENFNIEIKAITFATDSRKLLPAAVPAEMLANRPDIQADFLQVQQTKGDKSQYEHAMLNYKNTVHTAFQEVDDALLSFKEDQESLILEKTSVKNAFDDYKSAEIQYKSGQIDYATYLNFELRMLQNEYDLANQNLLVYEDIIQIYKTLGSCCGQKNSMNHSFSFSLI